MKKTVRRVLALFLTMVLILPAQCVSVFAANGGWRENFLKDSKQLLCSGDYRISSALKESQCLDIYNGSLDNNGKVILHKAGQNNASQVFRFTYKGNGYYEIMNLNCDKYLYVDHGYKKAGTKILTYSRNNSSNQLWKLEKASGGYWMISSKCNGLYMDAKDGKSSNGTQLQVWGKNNTAAQKWIITKKDVTSKLKISGAGSPGNLAVGKAWPCTGKITSNYKIINVTGEIVGSSYKKSVNPRSGTYNLKGSAIDKALLFNKLKKGTYTYKITAKDMSHKTFTLVNKKFTVGNPGKTSTLKISSAGSPGTLTKGNVWSCTGKITSNYKITKVVGEIVGKYSKTVKPNKTSYSLKGNAIDKALLFNKLGVGTYTYKISATDASGKTKTLVNKSFKVINPPSNSGGSTGINGKDVFLKQKTSSTCTLSASAMMLRRKAILKKKSNWSSITETSLKKAAWPRGSLEWSFEYSGMSVRHNKISGKASAKKSTLISLLKSHPEGIVIYDRGIPHAVLLTDYTNGCFYCGDPASSVGKGRISLSKSWNAKKINSTNQTTIIGTIDDYWYVK